VNNISYHSEDIKFKPSNWKNTVEWLKNCIEKENKTCGDLSFIFCNDAYLLKINIEYLNHDTYTDVITFNYVEENTISGDVFISIERVKENAATYKVSFAKELLRVLVHATLHLIGYDDQTTAKAEEIREKEDFYLTLHPKI